MAKRYLECAVLLLYELYEDKLDTTQTLAAGCGMPWGKSWRQLGNVPHPSQTPSRTLTLTLHSRSLSLVSFSHPHSNPIIEHVSRFSFPSDSTTL